MTMLKISLKLTGTYNSIRQRIGISTPFRGPLQ